MDDIERFLIRVKIFARHVAYMHRTDKDHRRSLVDIMRAINLPTNIASTALDTIAACLGHHGGSDSEEYIRRFEAERGHAETARLLQQHDFISAPANETLFLP